MPRGKIYWTDDQNKGTGYIKTGDGRRIRFHPRNLLGIDSRNLTHTLDVDFVERGKSKEALLVRPAKREK